MELRFVTARSTRDLDFALRAGNTESALDHLQRAGAREIGDFFAFRIGEAMKDLDAAPYGGARYPVESRLDGRTFVKFHVNVGIGDLIPTRSAIGDLVFKEDQFLLARIGISENSYESIIVPRYRGQALHKSAEVGDDDLYYRWVVPQWIHYGFKRPLPDKAQWRIWVLTDDLGRECYMSSDKRPWED